MFRIACVIALLLTLASCTSIDSTDMVLAPDLNTVAQAPAINPLAAPQAGVVAGGDRLDQLLAALDALHQTPPGSSSVPAVHPQLWISAADNRPVLDPGSEAAASMLREPVVRKVVAAMVEARRAAKAGEEPRTTVRITSRDLYTFGHSLGSARRSMMDDLTSGKARLAAPAANGGKPTFAHVLGKYYVALANGKFIDRRGQQLAKLKFTDGIGNETLGELATVFFEALFDHALFEEYPLYYRTGAATTVMVPQYGQISFSSGASSIDYSDVDTLEEMMRKHPASQLTQLSVKPTSKPGEREYLITDGKVPTGLGLGTLRPVDINTDPDHIVERQLKAVRTVSNFVGQRAKGASSLVFGFLGKIDISFVVGAGFSVGDNKTLVELVGAIAEVASRRASEYAAYRIAVEWNNSHPQGPGAAAAPAGPPQNFWDALNP